MKVPISWLKEYVRVDMPVEALADMLTIAGLEVAKIEYIGIPGGDDDGRLVWDRDLLVVGRITKVEQHPNADRLVLATVEYGADEPEVVVTGAPNLFDYLGEGDLAGREMLTPFALEGATVYDGHKEGQVKMTLKGRELRGIYNKCMVCSSKELGLGEDHDGIMLFSAEDLQREEIAPGTPLQDVFGDAVLDIEIIPNIARCASVLGVAREVAALTNEQVCPPEYEVVQEGEPLDGRVKITTTAPELNPRFVGMLIEGVQQKESPLWMKRRLQMAGQRPINVVVDVSNYVMLEMGQPNHTFDYDFLRRRADEYAPNGPIHIETRLARPEETITTLDGQKRDLPDYTILVTDPAGNLSIGGIMGGAESEIGAETTDVLLEAAAWNYINIRRSSHALKLNTEAGFRFSRGVHPSQAILGAKRAAELLRKYADGTVAQGMVDYYPHQPEPAVAAVTAEYVRRWSGLDLSAADCKQLLERLDFQVQMDGDVLKVTAPDHRLDIEGAHDLVEEICRMYGYDRIPATEMGDVLPPQRANERLEKEERIKDVLAGLGMQEVIAYRLTTPEQEAKLRADGEQDERPYVRLANYSSADRVAMRHSVLSSVAEIAADNSRHAPRIAIFEVGAAYLPVEDELLPYEDVRLAMVMAGRRRPEYWGTAVDTPDPIDFYDLKGVVEDLLAALHIDGLRVEPGDHPTFRPGRTAKLLVGNAEIGWLGEFHPLVKEALEFRHDGPVIGADLDVDALMGLMTADAKFSGVSSYPAIREDLALLADKEIPEAEVAAVITQAGGFLLKSVQLFDVYEGEGIPDGRRNLAYHLTFQAPDKTLKDRVVKKLRKKIIARLDDKLGVQLRE